MGYELTSDRPCPHPSAYYGMASIAIAGVLLLMAVPALQLANTLQQSGYKGFERSDIKMAAYGGYTGAGVVLLLALSAAAIAVAGVRVAGRGGEPSILCVAGLLLALLAALVWVGCAVAWHSQAWRFIGGA